MDKSIQALLNQRADILERADLECTLEDAINYGDYGQAMEIQEKTGIHVTKEQQENLLLNAICLGKAEDAFFSIDSLGRGFTNNEIVTLMEATILTGNIKGVFLTLKIAGLDSSSCKAFTHSSVAIAVFRYLKELNHERLRSYGNLSNWLPLYKKEIQALDLNGETCTISLFPKGGFVIFDTKSIQRLLGILLAHSIITKKEASDLEN